MAGQRVIQWQPHMTLKGELVAPLTSIEVVQPSREWLETLGMTSVLIRTISANCHLYVETSATVEGPWLAVADWTTANEHTQLVSPELSSQLMMRYLRWRFESTLGVGFPWTICFRLTAMPRSEGAALVSAGCSGPGCTTAPASYPIGPASLTNGGERWE